jgi:hypothetical protein
VIPQAGAKISFNGMSRGLSGRGSEELALARSLRRYAVGLALLAAYAFAFVRGQDLAITLFHRQDVPVVALTLLLLLGASASPALMRRFPTIRIPRFASTLVPAFAFVVAAGGTWLVFGNFDLSRDEFMANFDAHVFANWRAAWPVPPEWRPYSHALMPLFMRDIAVEAGWISSYLPGNAILRAVGERTIGREFISPILAAMAVLALYRIGRKLWPDAPRAALLPALLLTLSPQFLITAMTPFAMSAHLAFNLLWLWCFLQGNRRSDAAALACGFVATGLHQLIFHPLFVAPFIAELLLARRYGRASLFIAGYGPICLFWLQYPQLAETLSGAADPGGANVSGGFAQLAATVDLLLGRFKPTDIFLMLLNMLRFAAWQHLLLIPLLLCAWPAIKRAEGITRPLLAGILLTLCAAWILMPWQGHGWGYRYLHGFLGSFALLAGYGWRRLDRIAAERRAELAVTSMATLSLILPLLMLSTRAIVAPYRAASAFIEASPADVVLVDGTGIQFALAMVRNSGNPAQRPLVMDMKGLTEADLRNLCARYDVRLFDQRHAVRAGVPLGVTPDASGARRILPTIGCDKPLPL